MARCNWKCLSILGVLILITEYVTSQEEPKPDFCSNPKIAKNFDVSVLQTTLHRSWNIQLANPLFRSHIVKYLKEMEVTNEDELNEICARDVIDEFDEKHVVGRFQGFSDQMSHWNCSIQDSADCKFWSVNNIFLEEGKFYVSYVDSLENHNMIGYVLCFNNGDVAWYASTLSKTITEEETATALEHFKSLGFGTENYVKLQSPTCQK